MESQLGSPLSKSETATLRSEIARLRSKYDAALVRVATTTRDTESKQLDADADPLLALQTALIKTGDLDTALEARELHQQTLKQLEELRTSKPKQAAQADARADPTGARPEPELPATGSVPLTPSAAKLTKIADSVKGKAGVQGAAPNAITFDAPSEDGRRGVKGILLKATSDGSGSGNTWAMDYSRCRSSRGLQLIHPRGKGHAIVHINKRGIGISTPREWIKVG